MMNPDEYDFNDKLSFYGTWYDYNTSYEKKFIVYYYPCDDTVELFDVQLNRIFLRRCKMIGIDLKSMYIGNEIRVYGRQIKLVDYADKRTEKFVGKTKEHTVAVIKPSAVEKMGEIIKVIEEHDFQIANLVMCCLSREQAMKFYQYLKEEAYISSLVEHLASGSIIALELVGENAVNRWNQLLGPSSPVEARKTAPNSLRANYGQERATNGLHGSLNSELAIEESKFFFKNKNFTRNLSLCNTTCCVIKPHAILEGNLGRIIVNIENSHFKVNAMEMFHLNNVNAEEFLEIYKTVITDFHALLVSFQDGPCVVLEIASKCGDMNVHREFRNLCGPPDPETAKLIRPNTLRAKFGVDKYKNAVHCTDLEEDTILDLEYFFKILLN